MKHYVGNWLLSYENYFAKVIWIQNKQEMNDDIFNNINT